MHSAHVQFARPDFTIVYDIDPKQATSARKNTFAEVSKNKCRVASYHIPFPIIGHICMDGAGYKWFPANYSTSGNAQKAADWF